MEYGVYTSTLIEIAQTKAWTLCLYCNNDKTIIGSKLYNGTDNDKTLVAVVEHYSNENKTVYAYKVPNGAVFTNDYNGVCKFIGENYSYNTNDITKIDSVQITNPYEMPTVSEKGIAICLKQWRMGTFYNFTNNSMNFQMITNNIEYVFMIINDDSDIYCGASINIPNDTGMFGSNQYFRIRNFADNSKPFCGFYSNLGNDIIVPNVPQVVCESGTCSITPHGLYWPLKRYTDDEIVLEGCGGDEYIYNRNREKCEYFN